MSTWLWVVVALLIGALLGGLGVFLVARRRWADAVRSEELQRQLDEYRSDVGDHFVETAELVNNLTRSYKAVYDHLEQGAYRLVDEETLRKQLGDVDAESVRLEYIGRRNKAAVLGSGLAAGAPRPESTNERQERETAGETTEKWSTSAEEDTTGEAADGQDRETWPDDARDRDASVADQSAWATVSTAGSAAGVSDEGAEEESVEGEASLFPSDERAVEEQDEDEPDENEPSAQEKAGRTDGPLH